MSDVIPFPPKPAETEPAPAEAMPVDSETVSAATVLGECAAECLDEVIVVGVKQGQLHLHASGVHADRNYYLLACAQKAILGA